MKFDATRRRLLRWTSLLPASLWFSGCVVNEGAQLSDKSALPLYAMALLPPPALSDMCAAVRRQLDPLRSGKTFPHITLKQPFVFADRNAEHEEELFRVTRRVCERLDSFSVQLQDVSAFTSPVHGGVLHVKIALSPALHQLQQELTDAVAVIGGNTQGMTPAQETRIYYPHLTLAQGLTAEAVTAALASDVHRFNQQKFLASAVVLGRCDDGQTWQKINTIPLRV